MTDKELLELAAKACGYKEVSASYRSDDDGYPTYEFWYLHVKDLYDGNYGDSCVWNPLTDDGDALRLAVKLGLPWESGYALGRTDYWKIGEEYVRHDYEGSDVTAATRRAIVRAAAEIEKEKS